MFWYETDFKEIQPGCVTFAWRHGLNQTAIDAARANKAKIMLCPGEHCYLDYPMDKGDLPEVNWGMPVTSLKRVYELDPRWGQDDAFERDFLFGVTGTLWSECMPQPERVYYQAFPRAMALAEVGWTPQARRNYDQFCVVCSWCKPINFAVVTPLLAVSLDTINSAKRRFLLPTANNAA